MAWPVVGLTAVLILGPGGLLKAIVRELSSVTSSVEEFKSQVQLLQDVEMRIGQSTETISDLRSQLQHIEDQLKTIRALAGDLVSQSLSHVVSTSDDTELTASLIIDSPTLNDPEYFY